MRNRTLIWLAASVALSLLSATLVVARFGGQLVKPINLGGLTHVQATPISPATIATAAGKSGFKPAQLPTTAAKPVTLNAAMPYDPDSQDCLSGNNLLGWDSATSWIEIGGGLVFINPGHKFLVHFNWLVTINVTGQGSAILQWNDVHNNVITEMINVTGPTQLPVALPYGNFIVVTQPKRSDIFVDNVVIQPM